MPDPVPSRDGILRTAVNLVLRPAIAWDALGSAPLDLARMWRHLLVLGAIGPLALFLGIWLFDSEAVPVGQALLLVAGSPMNGAGPTYAFPLDFSLLSPAHHPALLNAARSGLAFYAAQIAIVLLAAGMIWLLAPYCQGKRDARAALAVVIYGSTPFLLSAIGLVKGSLTPMLVVGMMHGCVVAQRGVRRLLGAPGNDAAMLLGFVTMALYVLIPLLAYVATLVGVPLTG